MRVCDLADGGKLFEDVSGYSDEKRSYQYAITEGSLPVENYSGSFSVEADGEGSLVVWDAEFDVLDSAPEDEVLGMLDGVYKQSLESLRQQFD